MEGGHAVLGTLSGKETAESSWPKPLLGQAFPKEYQGLSMGVVDAEYSRCPTCFKKVIYTTKGLFMAIATRDWG
jgi:hypothetical protein